MDSQDAKKENARNTRQRPSQLSIDTKSPSPPATAIKSQDQTPENIGNGSTGTGVTPLLSALDLEASAPAPYSPDDEAFTTGGRKGSDTPSWPGKLKVIVDWDERTNVFQKQ